MQLWRCTKSHTDTLHVSIRMLNGMFNGSSVACSMALSMLDSMINGIDEAVSHTARWYAQ